MFRNTARSWGLVSILFHWVIAILFFVQFFIGYGMTTEPNLMDKFNQYQLHKSVGFLILGLAVLRLLWRLSGKRPVLPESDNPSEVKLAKAAHLVLYLGLFLIPLTGWAVVSTSILPIPTYAFNLVVIPHLPLERSQVAEQMWSSIHGFLIYLVLFVIAAHALAALRHHFQLKDRVLLGMLIPGYKRSDKL